MANVFVTARHHVDNRHIMVSRTGKAPFMMIHVADLDTSATGTALSLQAAKLWLAAKGIVAAPLDMDRKHAMETPSFPYAVRVRCLAGMEG